MKMPWIFLPDKKNMLRASNEPNPECKWVFEGKGKPYSSAFGMICLVSRGLIHKPVEIPDSGQMKTKVFRNYDGSMYIWVPTLSSVPEDHIYACNHIYNKDGLYILNYDVSLYTGNPDKSAYLSPFLGSDMNVEGMLPQYSLLQQLFIHKSYLQRVIWIRTDTWNKKDDPLGLEAEYAYIPTMAFGNVPYTPRYLRDYASASYNTTVPSPSTPEGIAFQKELEEKELIPLSG